jgi:hypothetical protein
MTAQASGLNSNTLSFKVVSRIPKPKRAPKPKTKAVHKSSVQARAVIQVQHNAVQAHQVQAASVTNGHLIDQAVHALIQNPLLFKTKKKSN